MILVYCDVRHYMYTEDEFEQLYCVRLSFFQAERDSLHTQLLSAMDQTAKWERKEAALEGQLAEVSRVPVSRQDCTDDDDSGHHDDDLNDDDQNDNNGDDNDNDDDDDIDYLDDNSNDNDDNDDDDKNDGTF